MDEKPFIQNDRTYIPLRADTLALGADVSWSQDNQEATITKGHVIFRCPHCYHVQIRYIIGTLL